MTIYASSRISASLVVRDDNVGAPLGYLATARPGSSSASEITTSLAAAGCKPRLISKHLDYIFGVSSWKPCWYYSDGVVSTVDVLQLRKAAFKKQFFAWFSKYRNQKARLPLDHEFLLELGYSRGPKTSFSVAGKAPSYTYGEILGARRGDAAFYVLEPPSDGVPDICDGLIYFGAQGQYDGISTHLSSYYFQWLDGTKWHVWMESDGTDYTIPTSSDGPDSSFPLVNQPSSSTDGSSMPIAELSRVADLQLRGVVAADSTYEMLAASTKQTSVRGMKLRPLFALPLSAAVEHVWWTVGDQPLGVPPSKVAVGNRGVTVRAAAIGAVLEQYATEANDAPALERAVEMKSSSTIWQLQYVGARPLRRKASETALAAEGDISSMMDELVIEAGRSSAYPSGASLRDIESALVSRATREGLTFSHIVVQGAQDYDVSRSGTYTITVGYVGGSFTYNYPGVITPEDILAALSDGGSVVFTTDAAAHVALAASALKTAEEHWALDTFGKTIAQLRSEAMRLSTNVSSRWDPSHYCDPYRPWVTKDVDAAELAFVQEMTGAFDARAMLIALSETQSFSTFK